MAGTVREEAIKLQKNIGAIYGSAVEKYYPPFEESGSIISCESAFGYPLTVQTDGATKVYRSGKNIIPPWTGSRTTTGMTFKGNGDGSISVTGTPTKQHTTSCFIPVPPEVLKVGKTYSCTPASNSSYEIFFRWRDADGNWKNTERAGVMNRVTWDDSWSELEVQIHTPNIQAYNETVWLQLELGETATDYEPYRTPDEFALGEAIPTLGGVNTIWADSGDVTVTGRADPIKRFCPAIYETAPIVACEPVFGYPLTVKTDGATKVYRCGKNLLTVTPKTFTSHGLTFTIHEDGTTVINGTVIDGDCYEPIADIAPIMAGVTYTLSGCTGGGSSKYQLYLAASGVIGLYNGNAPATGVAAGSREISAMMALYEGATVSNLVIKPQLEIGSSATDFETGLREEFTPGEPIPALNGVNTIWADTGNVTVKGRADPIAMIEKLSNAASAASTTV